MKRSLQKKKVFKRTSASASKRVSKKKSIKKRSNKRKSSKSSRSCRSDKSKSFTKYKRLIQKGGQDEEPINSPSSESIDSTTSNSSVSSNSSTPIEFNWPQLYPELEDKFMNQMLQHFKENDVHHNVYFNDNQSLYNFLENNSKLSNKLKQARYDIDGFFKSDVKKIKISFIDNNYQDMISLMKERERFFVDEQFNNLVSYFIKLLLNQEFQYLEKMEANKLIQNKSNLYIVSVFIVAYLIIKQEYPEFDKDESIKYLLVPKSDDHFHFLNQ